jgi:hypothetical protein
LKLVVKSYLYRSPYIVIPVFKSGDADPGCKIIRIRNPRFGIRKKQYLGSYLESLVTIFLVKILQILCQFSIADPYPGWKKSRSGIRDGKIQIRDPG